MTTPESSPRTPAPEQLPENIPIPDTMFEAWKDANIRVPQTQLVNATFLNESMLKNNMDLKGFLATELSTEQTEGLIPMVQKIHKAYGRELPPSIPHKSFTDVWTAAKYRSVMLLGKTWNFIAPEQDRIKDIDFYYDSPAHTSENVENLNKKLNGNPEARTRLLHVYEEIKEVILGEECTELSRLYRNTFRPQENETAEDTQARELRRKELKSSLYEHVVTSMQKGGIQKNSDELLESLHEIFIPR